MYIVKLPDGRQHKGTHTSVFKTPAAALSSINYPVTPTVRKQLSERVRDAHYRWDKPVQGDYKLWRDMHKEAHALRKKIGGVEYWKLLEQDGYKLIEVEIKEKE